MDNYKIKVKDEAESKEAQELFFAIGFQHRWDGAVLKESWSTARLVYAENGILWAGNCSDDFYECEFQLLTLPQLRDLVMQSKSKDQVLISGAEALKALLEGQNVHYSGYGEQDWDTALNCNIGVFLNHEKFPDFSFKIVPRVIKLALEIPAPYKAKIGGRDDTSFVLNVGRHQYLYQNEDDYTKARNALEAVFDAALGGNNS